MIRELKKEIRSRLIDLGCPVGFNSVPDNEIYPHIILDLPTDAYQEGAHNMSLDIDVWDKSESTKNVDEISEGVIARLNRICLDLSKSYSVLHLLSMGSFESDDPTLRRKTLIFNLRLRSKENGTM
jgi:hypothetical protein